MVIFYCHIYHKKLLSLSHIHNSSSGISPPRRRLTPPVAHDSGAAPGLTTSQRFTGLDVLTVMPLSLLQEMWAIKDHGEPWSLTGADMHTPVPAGKNILSHLHYALLGCGHGAHFIRPACEDVIPGSLLSFQGEHQTTPPIWVKLGLPLRRACNTHTASPPFWSESGKTHIIHRVQDRGRPYSPNIGPIYLSWPHVQMPNQPVFLFPHAIGSLLLNRWIWQLCWDAS